MCRLDRWVDGTVEAVDWFRQRSGRQRLVLVAECGALVTAYWEVMRCPAGVSAVGVLLPLAGDDGVRAAHPTFSRRALAGRGRRLGRRAHYGPADITERNIWPAPVVRSLAHSNDMLVEISRRAPLWVLCAPDDPATADLARIEGRLAGGAGYEFELAPPAPLGPSQWPGGQEIVGCTTAWAARHLGLISTGGAP